MKELVAKAKDRNSEAFWEDDCIELFLDPQSDGNYRHIYINSEGVIGESFGKSSPGGWKTGTEVEVDKEADRWIVEGKIHFSDLGFTPESGKSFKINVNRTKTGKSKSFWEETAWSPTFDGSSHVPSRFGTLKFR